MTRLCSKRCAFRATGREGGRRGGMKTSVAALTLASIALGGCSMVRELPAPNPPAHITPALRVTPDLRGDGTLVAIGTDTPARIEEVTSVDAHIESSTSRSTTSGRNSSGQSELFDEENYTSSETTSEHRRPVCFSPCATKLAVGKHTFRVFSLEPDGPSALVSLDVGQRSVAFRYTVPQATPGSFAGWMIGKAMWGLGLAATVVGGLILGIGLAGSGNEDAKVTSAIAGGVTAGIGLVFTGSGIAIQSLSRGTHTPGRGTAWTQDPPYVSP